MQWKSSLKMFIKNTGKQWNKHFPMIYCLLYSSSNLSISSRTDQKKTQNPKGNNHEQYRQSRFIFWATLYSFSLHKEGNATGQEQYLPFCICWAHYLLFKDNKFVTDLNSYRLICHLIIGLLMEIIFFLQTNLNKSILPKHFLTYYFNKRF